MNFSINSQLFHYIQKYSSRYQVNNIEFLVSGCEKNCLGFIIPKSVGIASKRNKFKRRCKNVYEILKKENDALGIILRPKDLNVSYSDIYLSFIQILNEYQINYNRDINNG